MRSRESRGAIVVYIVYVISNLDESIFQIIFRSCSSFSYGPSRWIANSIARAAYRAVPRVDSICFGDVRVTCAESDETLNFPIA